jgi:aspartyl-tRNA(Asn)/glutamyl-tRNA(Gln) amidotransferase subunit A
VSPAATPDGLGTAAAIAAAVRSGRASAREVLEGYLAQIEQREPDIHAFNLVTPDEARAAPTPSTSGSPRARTPARSRGSPSR